MKKIISIAAVCIFILILNYFGMFNWLKGGFGRIMGWKSRVYSSLITEQEETIEDQLAKCRADLIEIKDENKESRRLLGAKTKPETKFELAKLSSVGNEEAVAYVEYPGEIQESASVVSGQFLMGRVNQIVGKSAKIELLISSKTRLPVKIWPSQDNMRSEAVGEGILVSDGQNFYVNEILDSQEVKEDYWVGAIIESGDLFWIGKIEEVIPSEDKIFQQAKISWAVDLTEIITVAIIK
jgi:cell shape-determining protein MreC